MSLFFKKIFQLDLRSLALFRVGLATILILDLLVRWGSAEAFYADRGLMPRGPLIEKFTNPLFFSVFNMAGAAFYVHLFFALALICYFMFLLGFRTKLFHFLSWFFFVSFSARAPMISHAGDDLIRLALMWSFFLPLAHFFSIDGGYRKDLNHQKNTQVLSVPSAVFILQLIIMYSFTALLKWHPVWSSEGSALYFTLQLDQFITPFGALLRELPYSVLQLLTYSVYAAEIFVPLFVFIPFKNSFFKIIAIVVFCSFHLGLFFSLYLGLFPWICIVYWLAFLPAEFWDWLKKALAVNQPNQIKIIYDHGCGYCLKMVHLFQTFLGLQNIPVLSSEGNVEYKKLIEKNNSWVVFDGSKSYYKYEAFLILLKNSGFKFLYPLFSLPLLRQWGEKIYSWQTDRRSDLGERFNRWVPLHINATPSRWATLASSIVVIIFFSTAIYWNLALMKRDDDFVVTGPGATVGSIFRLHQSWSMFAPYPRKDDGWYVFEGTLINSKVTDVFYHRDVSFEKPDAPADLFINTLWRKYLSNIWSKNYSQYRLYFGRYLCREWDKKQVDDSAKLATVKIYYMLEMSKPYGEPASTPEKELIWDHNCLK